MSNIQPLPARCSTSGCHVGSEGSIAGPGFPVPVVSTAAAGCHGPGTRGTACNASIPRHSIRANPSAKQPVHPHLRTTSPGVLLGSRRAGGRPLLAANRLCIHSGWELALLGCFCLVATPGLHALRSGTAESNGGIGDCESLGPSFCGHTHVCLAAQLPGLTSQVPASLPTQGIPRMATWVSRKGYWTFPCPTPSGSALPRGTWVVLQPGAECPRRAA